MQNIKLKQRKMLKARRRRQDYEKKKHILEGFHATQINRAKVGLKPENPPVLFPLSKKVILPKNKKK
jgi:hypothetical protein